MATSEEVREWLTAAGHEVPARGRIRKELQDLYDAAHVEDDDEDDEIPAEPEHPEEDEARVGEERAPVRPRRPARRGILLDSLLGSGKKEEKPKPPPSRKKPAPKRRNLEGFLTRVYQRGGQIVSGFAPSTGRCLQAQAAVAGVILEDVVKETFADRLLQPAARAEDKLDKVFALAGPPAIVLALEMTQPEDAMRRLILTQMLRESLLIGMDVTKQYSARIEANTRRSAENEKAVDGLMQFIFGGPEPAAQHDDADEPMMAAA